MEEYIVVVNGKPQGPYSLDQLRDMKIKPGTFVKTKGMDDYKEASEIPELCELLGIKSQVRKPQYFASLDVRLLAIIIDYFLIFAIYCVVATVVVLFLTERDTRIIAALSGLVIIPIVKMIYGIVAESSPKQGTYGKVLMGLKVTDEQGNPITSAQAVVRNVAKLICIATLGLGYAYGFFDKRQQGLHDKMAGTLVIKDRLL